MAERDLTAPVSPENQECSPPRGESEENQVEVPLKPSKLDHQDPQEELVRIAAEAIVLIGSSGFQSLILNNAASEPLKACRSDVLQWFADVVSSLSGSPGDEVDCGDKNIFSDGSDYFETMTLNLTETKEEEYCFTSIGQREEETGSNVAPDLPRRARTRRARQRKDFQTEVLPSLASLSRHEVTEDLQTFGGLMEAAGTPLETASGRRNSSRNACTRGRKLQRNMGTELATGERRLAVWGKKNKRQRIQRFSGQ